MSGGGRKERAANSLEEERSRWLFDVTVVHACPEYLRAGDGLNYFHVPLRVNDRTIDDKSQIRSIPLPFNFSLSNSRGEKSDTARFRLRATTRETAIRVLGKKKEFGRTRDGFETICRFYGISENRGSIEWRAFFFFGRHVEFAARDAVAKSKAKKRYRSWFNLCVNSWVFSTQFVLSYDDFLYLLRKYNNNNNTTRFEIDDLKNSFKEKWSLILSVNLSDRRFLFSNFSQSCTCIDDPTGFKRIFPRRNWNFNLRKKWKPRLSG